jgi:hypothetical protein
MVPQDPHHLGVPSVVWKTISETRYVQRKPCTYLAPSLPLSPKGLNQASTWASSPRTTTDCVQNDFWANGMFGANRAPILYRHNHYLQTDWNKIPPDPRHIVVLSGVSIMIFEPLVRSMQTVHLFCIKITTISKWTEPSFHLSLVTPSGVSEMIFEPMRCLAQTVHPSCTDT